MFADCFCAIHTLQLEFVKLEFANSSLPCEDNKIVMCIASGGVVELACSWVACKAGYCNHFLAFTLKICKFSLF